MYTAMPPLLKQALFRHSSVYQTIINRNFFVSPHLELKELIESRKQNEIIVSGKYIATPKEKLLIKEVTQCRETGLHFCPKCILGLNIKHDDVLILSQYVRSDGCMLPRRITGLCKKQQRYIGTLVTMAQKAGLMPNIAPKNSNKDPKRRFGWKKFNKYFDESTIKC